MEAQYKSQADHQRVNLAEVLPLKTPFVIYIEPSGHCNLNCSFCPQSVDGLKKELMSIDTWLKAIDQIAKFGEKIKLLRVCGNGEPLTNKNIPCMLKYAKVKNIAEKIELVTNGTMLHRYPGIAKHCTRIVVSVNDIDIKDNVKMLYENKCDCTIAVKTIGKKEGFLYTYGNICDEIFQENKVSMWYGLDGCKTNRWGEGPSKKHNVCVQIFKGLQIQADGEVVPCCVDWQRVNVLGNIHDESIVDIWEGEKLKNLRLMHLQGYKDFIAPCRECSMNDTCDPDNIDDKAKEILCEIS